MMSPSTSRPGDPARAEGLRQVALADESVELPTRWRLPLWALVLKLVLVTGGLLLLLHWALQRLPDDRPALDLWSLLGAILLNQLALYAAAWRLQATLAAFGVSIRRGQAMRIHLQSLFYFFFVPMSVGLEIARFLKVRDIDPTVSAKRLLFALLFDRVLGLAGVLLVVGMLLPLVLPALLPQLWHPGWLLFAVSCRFNHWRGELATSAVAGAIAHDDCGDRGGPPVAAITDRSVARGAAAGLCIRLCDRDQRADRYRPRPVDLRALGLPIGHDAARVPTGCDGR